MRVMVLVKADASSEAGEMPTEQMFTEMMNYNQALADAGVLVSGDGLHPSSKGARVHFKGAERTVIDGPFAETKELVAGYWIWQVASMADAIEWAKKCPNPQLGESDIEIRTIFAPDDFGEAFTPKLREQSRKLGVQTNG